MKLLNKAYYIIILILCGLSFNYGVAQNRDFKQDSLQIKVYTEIEYVKSQATNITVKKVFCDYCSEIQMKYLSEKANELAYYDRYNPRKRLVNGIRKFAIIIRVSKKDFLALKNENDQKEN